MRILLVGSGKGDHFWALHVNRYTKALELLGHDVVSCGFRDVLLDREYRRRELWNNYYDLLILQDTHLSAGIALSLIAKARCYVLCTHSESMQHKRDIKYIEETKPDWIFTDQPVGPDLFRGTGVEATWMGHGADHACYRLPDKSIDVLWIGNKKMPRDEHVQREVMPLLDTDYNVQVWGQGYPKGLAAPSKMFDLMARSKIVIHIGSRAALEYGYSGTRISDALASGCYVVSSRYPRCEERYPFGVSFVGLDEIMEETLFCLKNYDQIRAVDLDKAYRYVREKRMAVNDMHLVLNTVKCLKEGGCDEDL